MGVVSIQEWDKATTGAVVDLYPQIGLGSRDKGEKHMNLAKGSNENASNAPWQVRTLTVRSCLDMYSF
jgi:hypothetical protein